VKDGVLRKSIKRIARLFSGLDLRLSRRFSAPPRYKLKGSCNGCGKCCESPSVQADKLVFHISILKSIFLGWHQWVNGFILKETDARLRLFVFHCTHYNPVSKQCDSYDSRPMMCRDYPVNHTFDAVPQLFDECGFQMVDKNSKALLEQLKKTNLSNEKLLEMKKKLFLDDAE
jgi:uncharacterized protein